ncbi:MAG: hypothetical protein IPM20_06475 [Gammaproteobacteria bacterium]|nr:hypothetical protein [Gammaproteobacteria bacterium]
MSDTLNGWFPVATLLLGFAASSVAEWFRDKRTRQREREARMDTRQDQLIERRTTFQRQTLLDLQDVLMQLVRHVSMMHHQDVMAFRTTGNWQKQLYDDELSEGLRLAYARSTMLSVRVRDGTVRQLVKALKDHSTNAGMCLTQTEGESHINEMTKAFEQLNERIGGILRELDD